MTRSILFFSIFLLFLIVGCGRIYNRQVQNLTADKSPVTPPPYVIDVE